MLKKNLGKGLSSLLRTENETFLKNQVVDVDIATITPNPFQPRKHFHQEQLKELSLSIQNNGIIQPILIKKKDNHGNSFELVIGERRWRACKLLGYKTIPAIVKDKISSYKMLEIALIENIQRSDLNPIEEAISYKELLQNLKLTHEALSERIGKSRASITNTMRLLKLPPKAQNDLINETLTEGHARNLLTVHPKHINALHNFICRRKLSVRQTEMLAQTMRRQFNESDILTEIHLESIFNGFILNKEKSPTNKKHIIPIPKTYEKILSDLRRQFGNTVKIKPNKNNNQSGKIEISYADECELRKILDSMDIPPQP